MKEIILSKIEKIKFIGMAVKSVTAIVGGSLILSENHPYLSLAILAIGALGNELVSFIKAKENEETIEGLKHEPKNP